MSALDKNPPLPDSEPPISTGAVETDTTAFRQLLGTEQKEKPRGFGKDFFALQIAFAESIARVKSIPLKEALLRCTCLYRRFGLPQPLNEGNPRWERFLSGMGNAESLADAAYTLYMENEKTKERDVRCFTYDYNTKHATIYMHFANNDPDENGPLSDVRRDARLAELKNMFAEIRQKHPEALLVSGSSWIYNIPNYRRLFPASYTQQLTATPAKFMGMSMWGQFVNRQGGVRTREVEGFMAKLTAAKSEEDIQAAFPLKQLSVEGNIQDFYALYGIQ